MTDEERQRTMDFIVEQQAQFSVNQQKADGRIDRLERVVKLIVTAGLRARRQMRQQDERFERSSADFDRRFAALMESQAHTDKRLDALIDIVRAQRNGKS